jgi:hypothetical protein
MAKKVTLQGVANLANVAQGTASQALNNKSGVSAATRDTVINAAKQLGYNLRYVFPDEVHTELKIIGVLNLNHEVFDRPGLDPFYMPVISGIEQECQKQNLSMIYCTVEANNLMQVTRLPETIKRTKLDGLVGIGLNLNKDLTEELRQLNCPVVLVDGYSYGNRFDSGYRSIGYPPVEYPLALPTTSPNSPALLTRNTCDRSAPDLLSVLSGIPGLPGSRLPPVHWGCYPGHILHNWQVLHCSLAGTHTVPVGEGRNRFRHVARCRRWI